jgi:hypothetical protein
VAYVEDNGPLDYQRRFDEPAALVAWAVNASQGGKAKFEDFLRYQPKNDLNDVDNGFLKLFGIKM